MTHPTIINALRAEIKRLEDKRREIDEQRGSLVATLRYFESLEEDALAPLPQSEQPDQSRVSSENLPDEIYAILTAERPMHRRAIHDRLVERGVRIAGRDPVNNVGAHLSLDPRFRSVGRGMWDLAEPNDRDTPEDTEAQAEFDEEDEVPW